MYWTGHLKYGLKTSSAAPLSLCKKRTKHSIPIARTQPQPTTRCPICIDPSLWNASGFSDEGEKRERLLVSHDYGEGYWEDHYYQGFRGTDSYCHLYDFDLIDVFNFFTHDRLSIPPPGWTNLAHKHGTQALGTFLVEGTAGEEGFEDCLQLLMYDDVRKHVVEQLVKICQYFGFEGYLLNIEVDLSNRTDVSHLMSNLLTFVEDVTTRVQTAVPNGLVLWYDAIAFELEDRAKEGELKWQDCLDRANAPFFHHSNGILTNYYWHPETLPTDFQNASSRNVDVYKGIDIFARGIPCYSAGFGCLSAIDQIQKARLSCGLFAPVFFYQNCPPEKSPVSYSNEFWQRVRKIWKWIRRPAQLPFLTHFSQGHGQGFFMDGHLPSNSPAACSVLGRADDGFNGGESLLLKESQASDEACFYFPLYRTHFALKSNPKILLSLVYSSEAIIGLSLRFEHELSQKEPFTLNITANEVSIFPEKGPQESSSSSTQCVECVIEEIATEFSSAADVEFYPAERRDWKRLSITLNELNNIDYYIESISIVGRPKSGTQFEARIAQLLLSPLPFATSSPPTDFAATDVLTDPDNNSEDGHGWRMFDGQLIWTTTASRTAVFVQTTSSNTSIHPNVFLGWTTSQRGYWIKNLKLKSDVTGLTFRLSVLDVQGRWTSLLDGPVCHVPICV